MSCAFGVPQAVAFHHLKQGEPYDGHDSGMNVSGEAIEGLLLKTEGEPHGVRD